LKIGLVLSGGGSRAFFHLGVASYLEQIGVEIDAISGVSGGSIAGAFLAKYTARESFYILNNIAYSKLVKFNYFRGGVFNLHNSRDMITKELGSDSFEDLNKRLHITALNLHSGKAEHISSGSICDAIIASCSLFPIFSPYKIDNTPYVDGGYVNNLPVEPLVDSVDKIIGISIFPLKKIESKRLSLIKAKVRLNDAMIYETIESRKRYCDYFLEEEKILKYKILGTKNYNDIYILGQDYAKEYFDKNPIM
jgi:NTE family protein